MQVIRHFGLLLLLFMALGIAVPPSLAGQGDSPLTLFVSVRENTGVPLSGSAIVRLSTVAGGQYMVNPTKDAATASFDVRPGDYEITVEAAGYDSATERVTVGGVSTFTVYIYLKPAGSANRGNKTTGGIVMTPDLQRELDKGLQLMREKKYEEARKHFEKARKLAPTNPDVLYLLGTVAYLTKDIPTARKQFETVLESYPGHERSLVMLGQIQLDVRENQEAAATLQKAIEAGPIDWQAHYLLALAYARTKEFEKARIEADRTVALKKEKKPVVELLKAKLLLMQQRNEEAQATLEALVKEFPGDPSAAEAEQYLVKLAEWRSSQTAKIESVAAPMPQPVASEREVAMRTAVPPPERSWAPPDVDAGVPPTAPNVACSTEEVVKQTQRKISSQLSDLEKFGAVEHIEHQTIDANGVAAVPVSQDFNYLIFVHHSAELPYYFDEMRNGAESLYQFPSAMATRGLVSLGFMVLHPVFYRDFTFTCEGLGTWKGRPAWQIHFVQQNDVPSRIRSWSYKKVIYPVPLKGRIWIAANSYNLLHLDTALREPVGGLRLEREQLSVDYGPVKFRSGEINLWLPWYAEMYFDLQGKKYHHRHTLTNYVLFNVDSENKVSAPAGTKHPSID